ncbi:MAG: SDR family oxidoreductase [Solirubrobacteraceae bacterium]|nr:SDR family oxidoreductase [Patulibacter sp.]
MSRVFSSPEIDATPGPVARHRSLGAVVVTGASTGIGEATALHLAALGYRVLAGVRNARDFETMRTRAPGIEPVMLDITDEDQIAALVEFVERTEPGGLRGLVNNAGVGQVGPIEILTSQQWRDVLEVNVIGTVAITRALMPSLFRAKGRVVNIGSAGGRMAFPLFGPYTASKFAMEGFSDVLRREIEPHGIRVVCVEPGVVSSAIYNKNLGESYERTERLSPDQAVRYRKKLDSAHRSAEEAKDNAASPATVAPAVAKALSARRPRTRYVVGWDSRTAVICARILPDRLADFIIARLTAN